MEKQREDNQAAEDREDRLCETPERKHTNVLLDVSKESFMTDLEPYDCHCYSGWEHAVQGWARVSPMSCITMNQKSQDNAKHREDEKPPAVGLKAPASRGSSTDSLAEQHCKTQLLASWGPATWPLSNAVQKYLPGSFLEGKTEKKCMPRETTSTLHPLPSQPCLSENRAQRAHKHTENHNVSVVPIKNFSFLPPINSQQLDANVRRGKKTPHAKNLCKLQEGIGGILDVTNYFELPSNSPAVICRHQARQQNPHLIRAVYVSVPRTRQQSSPPQTDTMHRARLTLARNMSQAMVPHKCACYPAI